MDALRIGKSPIVMKWEDFNLLLKSQFYPIGHKEEKLIKWKYIWKAWGQGVKEYTYEFLKQAIRMGLSLEESVMVVK